MLLQLHIKSFDLLQRFAGDRGDDSDGYQISGTYFTVLSPPTSSFSTTSWSVWAGIDGGMDHRLDSQH